MKTFFILGMLFILTHTAFPQPGTPPPDSIGGAAWLAQYRSRVIRADVLEGRSLPQRISPTGQKLCFDKKIALKVTTDRGLAEVCMFVNTKIGLTAYTAPAPGGAGICDIKPEDPQFKLTVVGMKGNVYTYMNNDKNGVIEHFVQTGNSDTYLYQSTSTAPNAMLYKKPERRDYCGGRIKAQCYKIDGKPEQWFLFGKDYPDAVLLKPAKYLGNFAVGYAYSEKGIFIVMQMIGAGFESKITELDDQRICFDPAPFKIFEDEMQSGAMANIREERERIARDMALPERYLACEGARSALMNFRKEALDRREENLRRSRMGNAMQDVETQKAMANLMNYDDMLKAALLETELNLCRAQQSHSESADESSRRRIDCLQRQTAALRAAQTRIIELNNSLRNEPGRLFAEKSRLFLQAMSGCD